MIRQWIKMELMGAHWTKGRYHSQNDGLELFVEQFQAYPWVRQLLIHAYTRLQYSRYPRQEMKISMAKYFYRQTVQQNVHCKNKSCYFTLEE